MRRLSQILLVSTLLVLPIGSARAQEACPAERVCVEYADHELILDPRDGPIQLLVIETTDKTTTNLDGQKLSGTATLVEFISTGDTFEQRGDPLPPYPKRGWLANAEVGDTFVPGEIN